MKDYRKDLKWSLDLVLAAIILIMLIPWVYFTSGQLSRRFVDEKYPLCPVTETIVFDGETKDFRDLIGDGKCQFIREEGPNILACGWDGGDCIDLNDNYPKCFVDNPSKLGNNHCDWEHEMYNSKDCGFDIGDCADGSKQTYKEKFGDNKKCIADFPDKLGDGKCDVGINNLACNFDGEDCLEFNEWYPNCEVENPEWIGDGWCVGGLYNSVECNFDGGDCFRFNALAPNCRVDLPEMIGNGVCQGGEYNTAECLWELGDCFVDGYPDCHVDNPDKVGDEIYNGGSYNIPECGWDGGDCLVDEYPNCHVDVPEAIGNGMWTLGEYNTIDCGWDGGYILYGFLIIPTVLFLYQIPLVMDLVLVNHTIQQSADGMQMIVWLMATPTAMLIGQTGLVMIYVVVEIQYGGMWMGWWK